MQRVPRRLADPWQARRRSAYPQPRVKDTPIYGIAQPCTLAGKFARPRSKNRERDGSMRCRIGIKAVLVVACAAVVSGCAQLHAVTDEGHIKETSEQFSRVDQHSSYPAMRRGTFEQVNLLELIDPKGESQFEKYSHVWSHPPSGSSHGRQYDQVLSWFGRQPDVGDWKRQRRNSVQDKILAVSTSRCNVFKTYLRRQQVDVNFTLGALTTASGVLGAVLPGVNASRNLAGAAGLFSGLRSEYNQSYYSNLAAHVIVQGIELRQNRLRKELVEARQGKSVEDYSMEAAINDAIVIDGTCSTVSGLIEAQEAIREVESPGLKTAARVIAGNAALRALSQASSADLLDNGQLEKLVAIAGADVPSMLVSSTKPVEQPTPDSRVMLARSAQARIALHIDSAAQLTARTYSEFKEKEEQKTKEKEKDSKPAPAAMDPGALRSAVAQSLSEAVLKPLIQSQPPGVLTQCVSALAAVTEALVNAQTHWQLVQSDPAKRVNAQLVLAQAQANAVAAADRVDRVAYAANAEVDSRTAVLLGLLKQKAAQDGGLKIAKGDDLTSAVKAPFVPGAGTGCP
ncbi:hypothetical protein [Acidovorax sp. Leaf84]|uniref:hypothetical protein n=1 Tax=Acidovorax sp. Leaf84 TaxID=1736240 RepID=UPI0012E19DF8|nr:hypothetical protein [Acidovorax sp. Leaf84]